MLGVRISIYCKTLYISLKYLRYQSELWIWIHWIRIRIRIQHFRWFFFNQIAIYLCPSYSRSLQPLKESIQHYKKWNLLIFSMFLGQFCSPGPDPLIWLNPDPKHWLPSSDTVCVRGISTCLSYIFVPSWSEGILHPVTYALEERYHSTYDMDMSCILRILIVKQLWYRYSI